MPNIEPKRLPVSAPLRAKLEELRDHVEAKGAGQPRTDQRAAFRAKVCGLVTRLSYEGTRELTVVLAELLADVSLGTTSVATWTPTSWIDAALKGLSDCSQQAPEPEPIALSARVLRALRAVYRAANCGREFYGERQPTPGERLMRIAEPVRALTVAEMLVGDKLLERLGIAKPVDLDTLAERLRLHGVDLDCDDAAVVRGPIKG